VETLGHVLILGQKDGGVEQKYVLLLLNKSFCSSSSGDRPIRPMAWVQLMDNMEVPTKVYGKLRGMSRRGQQQVLHQNGMD
jgi:hypothetical protein